MENPRIKIFNKQSKELNVASEKFYNLSITLYTSISSGLILLAYSKDIEGNYQKVFYLITLFLSIFLILLALIIRFFKFIANKYMMLTLMEFDMKNENIEDKQFKSDRKLTNIIYKKFSMVIPYMPVLMFLFIFLQLVSAFIFAFTKIY